MRALHHSRFGVVRVSERSTVSGPPRGRASARSQLLDVWWGAAVCVARRGAVPGNLVRILRWERRDGTSTRDRGGASAPQGARVPTPRRLRRRLRHKFFPAVAKSDARRRADRADLHGAHGRCFFKFILKKDVTFVRKRVGTNTLRLPPSLFVRTNFRVEGLDLLVPLDQDALPWLATASLRRNVKILKMLGPRLFPWTERLVSACRISLFSLAPRVRSGRPSPVDAK